ncbi:MAG: hypothetical protein AB7U85_05755 [Alphaproteobacteria bacterium]
MLEKQVKPEQEELYDILQNSSGDLLISIKARKGLPEEPKIVYDGGEHALLYRNNGLTIMLDYIHPEARQSLFYADTVLVVEFDNDDIAVEYEVPIRIVKKLPISQESFSGLRK